MHTWDAGRCLLAPDTSDRRAAKPPGAAIGMLGAVAARAPNEAIAQPEALHVSIAAHRLLFEQLPLPVGSESLQLNVGIAVAQRLVRGKPVDVFLAEQQLVCSHVDARVMHQRPAHKPLA